MKTEYTKTAYMKYAYTRRACMKTTYTKTAQIKTAYMKTEEEEWVTDQLNMHWNTGIPVSMEYLMQLLWKHVVHEKLFDAMLKSSKAPAQKNPSNGCDLLF